MSTPDDSPTAIEPPEPCLPESAVPGSEVPEPGLPEPGLLVVGSPAVAMEGLPLESQAAEPNWTTWSHLHPNYLAMERRTSWILFWILLGIMVPVNAILYWSLGRTWILFGCVMGTWILAGALLWLIEIYLPRSHDAAGWMLSDRGIEIRKGVWWQHVIVIPKSRIQHTDLQQGPVLRAYGLAKLAIFTAGTENAEVELEGLSLETAQHIRDRLMEASRQPLQGL